MRQIIRKVVPIILIITSFSISAQSGKNLTGKWKDEENPDKQIEMYEHASDRFYGKVINDRRKNSKNGFLVFRNLRWDEQSKTYKGLLINPDDASEFNVVVSVTGDDRFEFKVKRFFISKTFHFIRIH